jgi:surface antigen
MFIFVDFLLITLLSSAAQARHINTPSHSGNTVQAGSAAVHTYDSPNILTDGMLELSDNVGQAVSAANQTVTNGITSIALGAAQSGTVAKHAAVGTLAVTGHIAVGGASLMGRVVSGGFSFVGHGVGGGFTFAGHTVVSGFAFTGRAIGGGFGIVSNVTHVSSVIRPPDHTRIPEITKLRAQQAALIQSGTKDVSIASITSGVGGACDNGNGNGGYPAEWCSAAMDSVSTVPYSSDPINRECTSYVYWYFTSIEGFAGFRAWGNAKDWAATSNYPTRAAPAVGAIAVETAGAYGHVAIVQALPGQKYAGRAVPAGYVLVSEMNYDWNGHFRYSYSPLSKFSAYIYP